MVTGLRFVLQKTNKMAHMCKVPMIWIAEQRESLPDGNSPSHVCWVSQGRAVGVLQVSFENPDCFVHN